MSQRNSLRLSRPSRSSRLSVLGRASGVLLVILLLICIARLVLGRAASRK
jgi:hypothetical protein